MGMYACVPWWYLAQNVSCELWIDILVGAQISQCFLRASAGSFRLWVAFCFVTAVRVCIGACFDLGCNCVCVVASVW